MSAILPDPVLPRPRPQNHSTVLLALGAAAGLALAAWGLLGNARNSRLPVTAVARVNGTLIRNDDFERLVAAVIQDRRTPDLERERQRVLDRMIDEELLIQRAIDLGLVQLDRKVRAELTSSVIASVVNDVADQVPKPGELEDFLAKNQEYFTRPGRLRARQIYFRDAATWTKTPPGTTTPTDPNDGKPIRDTAKVRAQRAYARLLSGEPYERVKAEWGDFEVSPIPNALLPASKLREYVGPTLLRAMGGLEVGAWSEPMHLGSALSIVQLIEREPAQTPPLAEIRKQVETDWHRRLGDTALRDYLDELRDRSKIEIADGFK